jgi:N-acetylmuramoyl-L-alanine amidase
LLKVQYRRAPSFAVSARVKFPGATEVIFPLQVPVPLVVQQGDRALRLTLYNTTAQTDIIRLDPDPVISRLDWEQVMPGMVQYTFNLKQAQQWGYTVRYEGTSLVLSLRHPPRLSSASSSKPLSGIKILLDPGHGGKESGAAGPTGYAEKDANLYVSKLIANQLIARGATVYLTRETDKELSLPQRAALIDAVKPAIALSIHYNSLPDDGDPQNTKGFGTFWYHPQAQDLAYFYITT